MQRVAELAVFASAMALATVAWASSAATEQQSGPLLVTIVPHRQTLEIHRTWRPLLDRLEHMVGVHFDLKHYASIPAFESALAEGTADIAYMNPYHAFVTHERPGYIPIVRDNSRPLVGILVVRKDSAIRTPLELAGQAIAFPAPNAFAASLYMRALLKTEFGLGFESRYVSTHDNVYRHVLLRRTAAGGGVPSTLERAPKELRDALRVIYTTPGLPSHPLCAHPRVPMATRERIAQALLQLVREADGRRLLADVDLPEPVRADFQRDYATIAALSLNRFSVPNGTPLQAEPR